MPTTEPDLVVRFEPEEWARLAEFWRRWAHRCAFLAFWGWSLFLGCVVAWLRS